MIQRIRIVSPTKYLTNRKFVLESRFISTCCCCCLLKLDKIVLTGEYNSSEGSFIEKLVSKLSLK